ncbi:hypothetical protein ACE6H2_017405 [Prunus campanulata]
MDKAHPLSTPMVVRSLDTKKDPYRPKGDDEMVLGPEVPYLSAIGALMYLAQCTRPDIAFSVNLLARSMIHYIRNTCALPSTTDTPTILNEDNAACIAQITGGYIKGDRTKHISPKFFYTHELQKNQEIKVRQIRSSDNLADLFTKSLPKCTFQKLVHGIGLRQLCKQSSWSMQNQGEHSRVL